MALVRPPIPRGLHLVPHARHAHPVVVLIAMALAAGIGNFPPSAIAVALPTLHDELNASISELQWAITAYTLGMSTFLIVAGRLADIFGRRLLLMIGTTIFVAGAVLAAVASSALILIVGMAVSGVGFATMLPPSLAIVVNSYPPERRGLPIGIWGAATVVFQGVAPVLGGGLTGEFDWTLIFWFQAAVGALVILLVILAVPESRDPDAERRVDATGVGLLGGALVTLSLGIIQAPVWGWGAPQTVILLAAAVVLFTLFVLTERRSAAPLVNLDFFRQRNFTGATIVLFVLNFALIVALFFLPLLLQELLDFSPTEAGALLIPLLAAMVVMLPLGGRLEERIGPLPPITAGLGVTAVGFLLLAGVDRQTDYGDLWLPMLLVGAGVGIALTPMNVSAMNAVHARESGAAGGVFMTLSGIGIGFGVAITGSVFASQQLSETQSIAAERGIDLSQAKAEELDGLLAGASDAQRTLSDFPKGDQGTLEAVVNEAFVQALGSAFRVGALVAIIGLVLAAVLIRRRPAADEIEPAERPAAP